VNFSYVVSTLTLNIQISTMPRRSWTPEESKAQLPSHGDSRSHEVRTHKKHHRSHRSRSPRRDDDGHRHKRHRSRSPPAPKPVTLPYKAKPLSKRQYDEYRPLFQSYLDIQKQIQLDDLDERGIKGRWKSFVSRWYAPTYSYASHKGTANTNISGTVET
jgi:hypothetical protein